VTVKRILIVLFLFCSLHLYSSEAISDIYQKISVYIPEGKVLTVTEMKGNFSDEFVKGLISYLQENRNISFVDYDIHRQVLEESLRYSEPVFDDKYSDTMPRLLSPDISIIGSANRQRSNFVFKQKVHFDYEINLVEISTGLIIVNINDRILLKHNPPILLLVILIALVIIVARWVIYLKNGYNVLLIISVAMGLVTLIIVWYIL